MVIKLDGSYLAWLVACRTVALKDELEKQEKILKELCEIGKTKVIKESIKEQEKIIDYTTSEIQKLVEFKAQFPKGFNEYDFIAYERGEEI